MTRKSTVAFGNAVKPPHRPGQGLNWDAIRQSRREQIGEEAWAEEMERSPFKPDGTLKKGEAEKINAQEKVRAGGGPARTFDWEEAARLYVSGLTVAQTADRMGASVQAVRSCLQRQDVYVPNRDRKKAAPKPARTGGVERQTLDWDRIRDLWKQGNSVADIVKATDYRRESIRHALMTMGFNPGDQRGKPGPPKGAPRSW